MLQGRGVWSMYEARHMSAETTHATQVFLVANQIVINDGDRADD